MPSPSSTSTPGSDQDSLWQPYSQSPDYHLPPPALSPLDIPLLLSASPNTYTNPSLGCSGYTPDRAPVFRVPSNGALFHRGLGPTPSPPSQPSTPTKLPSRPQPNRTLKPIRAPNPPEEMDGLRDAISNPDSSTLIQKGGSIRAGTLATLLVHATRNWNEHNSKEDLRTVMAICVDITTPEVLFLLVTYFFRGRFDPNRSPPSDTSRLEYVRFMMLWVEQFRFFINTSVLRDMRRWLDTCWADINTSSPSVPTLSTLLDSLRRRIDRAEDALAQDQSPRKTRATSSLRPTSSSGPSQAFRPSNTDAPTIALQLTNIEGGLFNDLQIHDLVAYTKDPTGPFALKAKKAVDMNRRIQCWVKCAILTGRDPQTRAAFYETFVLVAKQCLDQRNLASLGAIVTALKSQEITDLHQTMKLASKNKQMVKILTPLVETIDPLSYRKRLESEGEAYVVPWLDVHLQELAKDFQETPVTYSNLKFAEGRVVMINFQRYSLFATKFEGLRQRLPPGTRQHQLVADAGGVAVLRELEKLQDINAVNAKISERSESLRMKELQDSVHRTNPIASNGFTF